MLINAPFGVCYIQVRRKRYLADKNYITRVFSPSKASFHHIRMESPNKSIFVSPLESPNNSMLFFK